MTANLAITTDHPNFNSKICDSSFGSDLHISQDKNSLESNSLLSYKSMKHQSKKLTHRTISQPNSLIYNPLSINEYGNIIKTKRSLSTRKFFNKDQNHESEFLKISKSGICTFSKNGKRSIFGGTLNKILSRILKWLVTEEKRETVIGTVKAFINGYRLLYSPVDFLNEVISFWDKEITISSGISSVEITRSAIMVFLNYWWESRIDIDFIADTDLHLKKWLGSIPEIYSKPLLSKYLKTFQQKHVHDKCNNTISNLLLSKVPKGLYILEFDIDTLADHLQFFNMFHFMKIPPSEIYSSNRPNWDYLLQKSVDITRWIAGSIVELESLSMRTKAIKKALKLIKKLLSRHDYNGAMSCWAGLNSVSVNRLIKTKKKLSNSANEMWKEYEIIFSESNNFSNLRKLMEKCVKQNLPIVPWLELITKGRNMIDEYPSLFNNNINPDSKYKNIPIINFSKLERMNELVEEFTKCQNAIKKVNLKIEPHSLATVIQDYISSLSTYNDSELWELSLRCEKEEST